MDNNTSPDQDSTNQPKEPPNILTTPRQLRTHSIQLDRIERQLDVIQHQLAQVTNASPCSPTTRYCCRSTCCSYLGPHQTPSTDIGKTAIKNLDDTMSVIFEGNQIRLQPTGNRGRAYTSHVICFICKTLAQINNTMASPSPHLFTKNGKLDRMLCPILTRMTSMEERIQELNKAEVCRACLQAKTSEPMSHYGSACNALNIEFLKYFKCKHDSCKVRYTLCADHQADNSDQLHAWRQRESSAVEFLKPTNK